MKAGTMENKLEIHVDDYAISENASKDIIELIKTKKVNGISIIPNFDCFASCMELLKPIIEEPSASDLKISIHINLMEGKCCAEKNSLQNLVDHQGYLKVSWGKLMLGSYNPFVYRKLKNEIKTEILSQIRKVTDCLPDKYVIRIDSHQHTHVLPVVFQALKEVIEENELNICYIRVPDEPLLPFLSHFRFKYRFSIINIVKNLLLKIYCQKLYRYNKKNNYGDSCLWGVLMSGRMDYERISIFFRDLYKYADSRNKVLEILFHAGSVKKDEITEEYSKEGFRQFHLSPNRNIEWNSIATMNEIIKNIH